MVRLQEAMKVILERRRQRSQQGYIMMALTLAVTLVLIGIAAGLEALSADLQRQREEELLHRGAQYARAIRKYYQKFGVYPVTLDQLESANDLRFLRRRYADPMTGGNFRLLHPGDVHISLGGPPSTSGATTQESASSTSSESNAGAAESAASNSPTTPVPSPMSGDGAVFGGGPIVGIASSSQRKSFHVFNNKGHYNDWQFIYVPALDDGRLIKGPYDGILKAAIGQRSGSGSSGQAQPDASNGNASTK
jgi:type II secretory pathway pseudopilin PulG